jgi:hypothetical protein
LAELQRLPSFFLFTIAAIYDESGPHEHGDGHDYQRAYYDPSEVNLAHQGFRDKPNEQAKNRQCTSE